MKHSQEVAAGQRFEFGKNWKAFLSTLTNERLSEAKKSIVGMLGFTNFSNKKFLDIGSGSGLYSLTARSLGAKVHSFDFDPMSTACTSELKKKFFKNDMDWTIEEGSVLDDKYLKSLGEFDIVYSWGVLHHTGNMWMALANTAIPVKSRGYLFVAIYNDEGVKSQIWKILKKTYCSGALGGCFVSGILLPYFILRGVLAGIIFYRNPLKYFTEYKRKRGMSAYHDWIDWLGGFPFEVAKPEEIFEFYTQLGFELRKLITTNKLGCNQFVFQKR